MLPIVLFMFVRVTPGGNSRSSPATGNVPPDQLAAVAQLPLELPSQVLVAALVVGTRLANRQHRAVPRRSRYVDFIALEGDRSLVLGCQGVVCTCSTKNCWGKPGVMALVNAKLPPKSNWLVNSRTQFVNDSATLVDVITK